MTEISVADLYELYLDTIGRCISQVLSQSMEDLECNLFEEFDADAHSFLHEDNLLKLREAGYIDEEMVAVSKEVRRRWLSLQRKSWTIAEIKNETEWHELFELCDRLKLKSEHYRS
jgi:hypothetical protein